MSVEKKVETMIFQAYSLHASDIHILPKSDHFMILFRISNQLFPQYQLNPSEAEKLLSHLKFQAKMDIGERRRPQNGSFSVKLGEKRIGLRLSTLPSTFAESMVIRIIPHEDAIPLNRLSLFPKSAHFLLSLLTVSHGLIIFTGPTGSGKTSTLYTLLRHSSKSLGRNVITLEDPVEKNSDDLLQVQVNEKAGITYASGLKAILRHDPDIIMVGEIRDGITAKTAVRAALTGHLVLTTMHTKNAKGALYRLMEFGVQWNEMDQTIIAVTAQRLVQIICPLCGDDCSPFCERKSKNRAAVYEVLYGKALKEALQEIKGGKMETDYPTLKKVISKGIAFGFIQKTEYERWVHDFGERKVEY
ncbi:competence type IV pilus ATPase ComGA [Fervidibacillus halotolerans]|uniref:Competence type IV pilus ATPase ComGA n=2 Tax=Fervidibacillus halotolerans TaxID=2980027 RepID=A0A9E8M1R5_9BACI|nr:competence type IV pilus ATPase ComGA [Fervidibacillus halotolerans]WAA13928.1 competence type IV pilus ATPase ComGA [Fervidibacillus halotolerans]